MILCWTPGTSIGVPLITRGLYLNLDAAFKDALAKRLLVHSITFPFAVVPFLVTTNSIIQYPSIPLERALLGYIGATLTIGRYSPSPALKPPIPAATSTLASTAPMLTVSMETVSIGAVDANVDVAAGIGGFNAGEGEYLPIVKVAPIYPNRALLGYIGATLTIGRYSPSPALKPPIPAATSTLASTAPMLTVSMETVSIGAVDANVDVAAGIGGFNAGEGEYLPIVKVAPIYPNRALSRGIEGYCIIEFVVTRNGTTANGKVIECTSSLFANASLKAASKFKYKPRVINGTPIDVPGVQHKITFELEK